MYPSVAFLVSASHATESGLQRAKESVPPFPPDLLTLNPAFALAAPADASEGNEFLEIIERDFCRLNDQADIGDAVTP